MRASIAGMLGLGYSRIFRSRWSALFWAAGILATAYSMTPSDDEAPGDQPSDQPSPHAHVNPWAKDKPAANGG